VIGDEPVSLLFFGISSEQHREVPIINAHDDGVIIFVAWASVIHRVRRQNRKIDIVYRESLPVRNLSWDATCGQDAVDLVVLLDPGAFVEIAYEPLDGEIL
jgi:hypothetical protein